MEPPPCLQQQQQISPYFNPTYTRTGWIGQPPVLDRHEVVTIDGDVDTLRQLLLLLYIQSSPYFDPTHTRTGWIGQPPILNRHEVVTIDGDVDTLRQATP